MVVGDTRGQARGSNGVTVVFVSRDSFRLMEGRFERTMIFQSIGPCT